MFFLQPQAKLKLTFHIIQRNASIEHVVFNFLLLQAKLKLAFYIIQGNTSTAHVIF